MPDTLFPATPVPLALIAKPKTPKVSDLPNNPTNSPVFRILTHASSPRVVVGSFTTNPWTAPVPEFARKSDADAVPVTEIGGR